MLGMARDTESLSLLLRTRPVRASKVVYITQYNRRLYCDVQYCTVLYYIVHYSTVLDYTILYYNVQYSTELSTPTTTSYAI